MQIKKVYILKMLMFRVQNIWGMLCVEKSKIFHMQKPKVFFAVAKLCFANNKNLRFLYIGYLMVLFKLLDYIYKYKQVIHIA